MGLAVSCQTTKNLTVNRQKRAIFIVNRQNKQLLLTVKRVQSLSNVTNSAVHAEFLALKESF